MRTTPDLCSRSVHTTLSAPDNTLCRVALAERGDTPSGGGGGGGSGGASIGRWFRGSADAALIGKSSALKRPGSEVRDFFVLIMRASFFPCNAEKDPAEPISLC